MLFWFLEPSQRLSLLVVSPMKGVRSRPGCSTVPDGASEPGALSSRVTRAIFSQQPPCSCLLEALWGPLCTQIHAVPTAPRWPCSCSLFLREEPCPGVCPILEEFISHQPPSRVSSLTACQEWFFCCCLFEPGLRRGGVLQLASWTLQRGPQKSAKRACLTSRVLLGQGRAIHGCRCLLSIPGPMHQKLF